MIKISIWKTDHSNLNKILGSAVGIGMAWGSLARDWELIDAVGGSEETEGTYGVRDRLETRTTDGNNM